MVTHCFDPPRCSIDDAIERLFVHERRTCGLSVSLNGYIINIDVLVHNIDATRTLVAISDDSSGAMQRCLRRLIATYVLLDDPGIKELQVWRLVHGRALTLDVSDIDVEQAIIDLSTY